MKAIDMQEAYELYISNYLMNNLLERQDQL